MGDLAYRVRGSYFESCNCEAICPCRKIGSTLGGRSTYGECYGVLSWAIESGSVDGIEVGGLSIALVFRYDDDEPDSPWRLVVTVLAYLWVCGAVWMASAPHQVRDWIVFMTASATRCRIACSVGAAVGVSLVLLGLFVY